MSENNFKKYNFLSLRIWHWLNMLVILGLLLTVLLRKTFLSWRTNSVVIETKLKEVGTVISPELSKSIATAIRDPLWDWHIYFGYALAALLLFRFLIVMALEKSCPGLSALTNLLRIGRLPSDKKIDAIHYNLVHISYAIFYLITFFMVITGFLLVFKSELGWSKDVINNIKEVHEFAMWFFVAFVFFHIFGVVIAETTKSPGIVSDMINGGKDLDPPK